jgi:hypothetical protein
LTSGRAPRRAARTRHVSLWFRRRPRALFVGHSSGATFRTGAKIGELPTNAEYGAAVETALEHAFISPEDAQRMAAGARANRIAFDYWDDDDVPVLPERVPLTKRPPSVAVRGRSDHERTNY